MKTFNLIIMLLAVTFFVACSKKKDGDSSPHYGTTPDDVRYGGYQNGYMPGYQVPTQANCQGPSQMFLNLGSYCGWLAKDGERICHPMAARQAFMQYCQAFATQLNYCVEQVRTARCYNTGCGYSYKGKWELYSGHSNRDRDRGSNRPRATYYERPSNDKYDDKYDDSYDDDDNTYVPPKQPIKPVIPQPEKNNCNAARDCRRIKPNKPELECKLPGEIEYEYTKVQYDILCKDSRSSDVAVAAPVQTQSKAQNNVQNKAQSAAQGCMDISTLQKFILDSSNKMSSLSIYMNGEIFNRSVSKKYAAKWADTIKAQDSSSYRGSITGRDNKNLTGIGLNVRQSSGRFEIDGKQGVISQCNDNLLTANFNTSQGREEISFAWNGLLDDSFEMIVTRKGTFKSGNESSEYLTSRYVGLAKNEITPEGVKRKIDKDLKNKDL